MDMKLRLLLAVAIIGPMQSVGGWLISGSMWPGYDPIKQTISDLASPESPVRTIQTGFFLFAAVLELLVAWWATDIRMRARIVIALGAIATIGVALYPSPLIGSTPEHRFFAIASFVFFSAWPLFAIDSKSVNPALRPRPVIIATILLTAVSVWFLWIWADKESPITGVAERVLTTSQALYLSIVLLVGYAARRKAVQARG